MYRALTDAQRKAHDVSFNHMRDQIMQRDLRDLTRPISPLYPAPDAHIIDSTHLDAAQVCAIVIEML